MASNLKKIRTLKLFSLPLFIFSKLNAASRKIPSCRFEIRRQDYFPEIFIFQLRAVNAQLTLAGN